MKRAVTQTYIILCQRYPDWSKLSLRKQFCLQFLKWADTGKKADRAKVVELAKLWRREPGRLGNHRTLLERKARKLFQQERRLKVREPVRAAASAFAKEQARQGGFFQKLSKEDMLAIVNEGNRVIAETGAFPNVSNWIVYPPEGEPMVIRNLQKFCREHGLEPSHMIKTSKLKRKHHKGWRAEKISPDWEDLMDG